MNQYPFVSFVGAVLMALPAQAGEEPADLLPAPSGKEPVTVAPTASGKEILPVSSLPSDKAPKRAGTVQPLDDPRWEIAITGGAREFDVSFDTKPTAAFQSSPLQSSEKLTRGYGGLELRRILWQGETSVFRFGLGYNYSSGSWDSGEHEAGEAPGEVYVLDISRFTLHSHQFTALFDMSWKIGRAWQVGVRAGPTLSIFDGDFTGSHESFVENESHTDGRFIGGHVVHDTGTELALGVMGEVFVRYTLPETSFFIELRGGYSWTDDMGWGDSSISASLDASSWMASVSLGYGW